jgi:hypothetical protein
MAWISKRRPVGGLPMNSPVCPSADGLVERFRGRQKPATRQAYAQDLQYFARFLGAESSQAARPTTCRRTSPKR